MTRVALFLLMEATNVNNIEEEPSAGSSPSDEEDSLTPVNIFVNKIKLTKEKREQLIKDGQVETTYIKDGVEVTETINFAVKRDKYKNNNTNLDLL